MFPNTKYVYIYIYNIYLPMDNFYWLKNHFKIPNDLFQMAFDLLAFWIEVIMLMVQKSQGQPPEMYKTL